MTNVVIAGAGLFCFGFIVVVALLCQHYRRQGYEDAAHRIFQDIRLYREGDGRLYRGLVAGLTEAMYISQHHRFNYLTEPTGLSRMRRPSPARDSRLQTSP